MIEEVEHMPVPAHAHAKLRADAVERALDDFGDPKRIDASLDSAVQDAADALTIFRVNADVRLSPHKIASNLAANEARLDKDRMDAKRTDLKVKALAIAFERVLGGAVEGVERDGEKAGCGRRSESALIRRRR